MKFKNRHEYIGGSDFGAVLGINPYKSRIQLSLEKAQVIADTFDGNEATRRGERLEDTVIQMFEEKTGLKVTDKQKVFTRDPQEENELKLLCHVDGIVMENGEEVLFEAKTTDINSKTWAEGIPAYYASQLEFNMFLSGTKKAYIAVAFCDGDNIVDFKFFDYYKQMTGSGILTACGVFSSEVFMYREKFGIINDGQTLETSEVTDEDITELDRLTEQIAEQKKALKPLEKQKESIEAKIKAAIGNHGGIVTGLYKVSLGNRITAPTSEYKICRSGLKIEYL